MTSCWKCRNEKLEDQEGIARFGLCPDHIMERVKAIMAEKGGTPHLEVV